MVDSREEGSSAYCFLEGLRRDALGMKVLGGRCLAGRVGRDVAGSGGGWP